MRIAFVVSTPLTVEAFLRDILRRLSESHSVSVFANIPEPRTLDLPGIRIPMHPAPIQRRLSPGRDLLALWRLTGCLRKGGFDAVHSVTPKAGLLAVTAARLAGIPHRTHTFTGQVWATRTGLGRLLLKFVDRLTARLATHCLVDSHSQRRFLLGEGVVTARRSSVLGDGSISGVDLERFRPDPEARSRIRKRWNLPDEALVFLFLGRMNAEKGISELVEAFDLLREEHPRVHLLLVGPDEGGLGARLQGRPDVHVVGPTREPEAFLNAADVLCLPSHREGFGSVIIEAAAVGIPAVGSRIYGITDAIAEGETGLLHEVRDREGLFRAMKRLAEDPRLRSEMGGKGRERARRAFSQERITGLLVERYAGMERSPRKPSLSRA